MDGCTGSADVQRTGGVAGELSNQTTDRDGTSAADGEGVRGIHRRGIDRDGEAAAWIGDGDIGVAIAGFDNGEAGFLRLCAEDSCGSTGQLKNFNAREVGEVGVDDGCGSSRDHNGVGLRAAINGGCSELLSRELDGVSTSSGVDVDGTTSTDHGVGVRAARDLLRTIDQRDAINLIVEIDDVNLTVNGVIG